MFTDDAGTDWVLNQSGGAWASETNSTTGASATNTIATPISAMVDGDQASVEVLIFGEESGDPTQTYFHRQIITYYRDGGTTTQWSVSIDDQEQRRGTFPTTLTAGLTVSGNDVIVNADTTGIVGTIDWTVLYLTSGNIITATGASPASSTPLTLFSVDAPPVSPETEDDEFTASALDAKWTVWNQPSTLTVGFDDQRLKMVQTDGGGTIQFAGIFQPVPSSEFTAFIKIASNVDRAVGAASWHMGLLVGDDLTSNPATSTFAALSINSGGNVRLQRYTDYNGPFIANMGLDGVNPSTVTYLRVRLNGTTISTDWSTDGQTWNMNTDSEVLPFTPGEIGIQLSNANSGEDMTAMVEFFRVVDGVSSFDQFPGRRITVSGTTPTQTWDTTVHATAFTALVNRKHKYDASTFAGNISMPASPANGDQIVLKNASSSTNNVTLSGNGNNVESPTTYSLAATATLSGDGAAFTYSFDGTQWLLI
jgi:hypothetical protein